jgi:HemY protein
MLRLVAYFLAVAVAAYGLSWLADNPGSVVVNWQGFIWDTNVFQLTIILALMAVVLIIAWTALRGIWRSPAAIGNFFNRRREKRGLEALSSGMIAIGAGDRALAMRYAVQARKSLPNEPMTHLLRAQAAQLADDRGTSRRIFEAMLASPDTEALGLRGLFLEAEREGEKAAARQFAARAVKLNPKLSWPVDALFDIQCRDGDWNGALDTLAIAKRNGHIEKQVADRRRAVLLTAQAQTAEDNDPERAMNLALEAHKLAVDLVPAAAIAGRILASRGSTPRATSVLQKTWRKAPHPELAVAYAYARLGDSPRDRLERVRQLAALAPNVIESPIAIANAAIEAKDFDAARAALEPLIESGRLTQRVCTLMARVESEQHGNAGGVREWLARAVNAPRDPAWTADGIVSEHWAAVSPVTGALDAFRWRVPVEAAEPRDKDVLTQKIEELVALGAPPETVLMATQPGASGGDGTNATGGGQSKKSSTPPADEPVDAEVVEVRTKAATNQPSPGASEPSPAAAPTTETKFASGMAPESTTITKPPATAKAADAAAGTTAAAPETAPASRATAASQAKTPGSVPEVPATPQPETRQDQSSKGAAGPNAASDEAKPERPEPNRKRPAAVKSTETKIFVAPRAPDDPGLDDMDDAPAGLRPRTLG